MSRAFSFMAGSAQAVQLAGAWDGDDVRVLVDPPREAELAHGALLLVDNAHGAYLHFLPEPMHPLDLGADICCDSAHKTLPVLTGGAYLHIARDADPVYTLEARRMLSLFPAPVVVLSCGIRKRQYRRANHKGEIQEALRN